MLVPKHYVIALKIGNNILNWVVDNTVTINQLAKFVCSKIQRFEGQRFEGLILSFAFEINTQKYEISDDNELRRVLSMFRSQKITCG